MKRFLASTTVVLGIAAALAVLSFLVGFGGALVEQLGWPTEEQWAEIRVMAYAFGVVGLVFSVYGVFIHPRIEGRPASKDSQQQPRA